jgi:cytochrome c oxidase cbb3-type subunit 2
MNPRDVVPESNMPGYPWLARNTVDGALVEKKMRTLAKLGHPYSEEDLAGAAQAVAGKTELEALIAYLQGLGTNVKPGG